MTLERFVRLLDAYGARMALWPSAERAAAQALLAGSEEARGLLAEARRLDDALSAARAPMPSAALDARLKALVGGDARLPALPPSTFVPRRMSGPIAGLALAASLALGLGAGLMSGIEEQFPASGGVLADWAAGAPAAETTVVIGLVDAEPWPYDTRVALTLY